MSQIKQTRRKNRGGGDAAAVDWGRRSGSVTPTETKEEGLAQAQGKQAASRDERQQVGVGTPGLPGHSSAAGRR